MIEEPEKIRRDQHFSEKPEWLQEFTEVSRSIEIHTRVLFMTSKFKSARGLKLQGTHAEAVSVKLFLVQEILVNWLQQITW